MMRNQVEHTKTERNVLKAVEHPFIVRIFHAFQTPKRLHFVLEFCAGGELFFHLSRSGRFIEPTAKFYAGELLLAIEYLHSLDIIYRDLKSENVLLDAQGHVKLTDFGLSKEGIADNISATTLCGTPEYLAPEMLSQSGHGKSVDWYSFGALIYEMLSGLPPFYTQDRKQLFDRIRNAQLTFPTYMSSNARRICTELMRRDPNDRLGAVADADDVKQHKFWGSTDWQKLYNKEVPPPFVPQLRSPCDTRYFDKEGMDKQCAEPEDYGKPAESGVFEGFTRHSPDPFSHPRLNPPDRHPKNGFLAEAGTPFC